MRIHAGHALLPEGWAANVAVNVDNGRITSVEHAAASHPGDCRVPALLPALCNLHSHTFQRGMAGMSEVRGSAPDSFWTWREVMYKFVDHLTPEDIETIAAMAFIEMQESGFSAVAEFHYVHHQSGGAPYDDIAELSARIFSAAKATGIGLTHLPVLYAFGGAGETPLAGGQLRFGNQLDRYNELHAAIKAAASAMPKDTVIGCAPHSLRAINPFMLKEAVAAYGHGPFHIHIAEQTKEVEEISAWLGKRPVAWLLDNAPVGPNWCLIHATHMDESEVERAAASGAVAGLCPITESSLGDGIFEGRNWTGHGGSYGVGSDSNIRISAPLELATLEYSQRLRHRERNVLSNGPGSTGAALYAQALSGGAKALGRSSGSIQPGNFADLAAINITHPALCALKPDQWLDGLIFAAPDGIVTDLWSAGRHCVREGRHIVRDTVEATYRKTMRSLMSRM